MAGNRIRSVRPDLIEHPRFSGLPDAVKALWLGLLPLWDDDGRSLGSVAYVHGRVCFGRPKGRATLGRELAQLEAAGWVTRFQNGGVDYMAVIGWHDPDSPTYQFVKDRRPSRLPAPPSESRTEPRTDERSESRTDARTLEGEKDPEGEKEKEREGESRARSHVPERAPEPPPDPTPESPHRLPIGWSPDPESEQNREAEAAAIARGVDPAHQLARFRELQTGTSRDWDRTWRAWLLEGRPAKPQAGNGRIRPKVHDEGPDDYTAAYNRRYPVLDDKPKPAPVDDRRSWAAEVIQGLSPYTPKPAAATADEPHDETDAGSEP